MDAKLGLSPHGVFACPLTRSFLRNRSGVNRVKLTGVVIGVSFGELDRGCEMNILKVLTVFLLLSVPVKAQQQDVQAVISDQIDAFLKDDFVTAYTFAAPSIQRMFGNSEQFGSMVRNGYPMIHRPSSYRFTEINQAAGVFYQDVLIEDQMGRFFIAEYAMVELESGWKIQSVRVYRRPAVGA